MIKLEVESYCHRCNVFDPVKKEELMTLTRKNTQDTIVVCSNRNLCRGLWDTLNKELQEEMGNGN